MKRIKLFIFIISLLSCYISQAHKLVIYATYESYKNNKGELHQAEYSGHMHALNKVTIFFDDQQKTRIKVKCKETWGFEFDGKLFRNDMNFGHPYFVVPMNKLIVYSNGIEYLVNHYPRSKSDTYISAGFERAVSLSLETEMYPAIPYKGYKNFKKAHPELTEYFNCLDKKKPYVENVEGCLKALEAKLNKQEEDEE